MNASYDKNAAIVVLPAVSGGRLEDSSLRTWLVHSDLTREPGPIDVLAEVVRELGLPYPEQGLAALRMWGQTGDRPTNWIAAADPVYLEPRLDHLVLHAIRSGGVLSGEMRVLIDHLQETLADGRKYGFTRLGSYAYISAQSPLATANSPAYVVDNKKPDDFMPSGEYTAEHRNLLSEIEMALHEHEVNRNREANGHLPVNSLWLWGGGIAPQQEARPQPPLFSDDPLLKGFWNSATGVAEPWPGDIATCIEKSVAGFVAETPAFADSPELLGNCLAELREALNSGRLSSLTLLFRGGLRAHVRRTHALRVWRRAYSLLDEAAE
jgi:hypothetical protein